MQNTKDFIPVQSVKENSVILSDGSVVMIIQTSAVNFDLLSENEQLAIIGSFAALLNSLSFSIQIVIRSKKLDISHYLKTLREAESKQSNPLLQLMMQHYRAFVAAIIRDNEVLDKQFYVVLAVSPIELGIVKSSDAEKSLDKALTILNPRRDHILKQLSRIGLKSTQLENEKLIRLFYDIYNDEDRISLSDVQGNPANQTPANAPSKFTYGVTQKPPAPATPNPQRPTPAQAPIAPLQQPPPQPQPIAKSPPPMPVAPPQQAQTQPPQQPAPPPPPAPPAPAAPPIQRPPALYSSPQTANHNPFVVEELPG